MGLKQWMAHLNHVLGEKIKSETLLATAQDSKNDVLATGAVLICAIFARITGINLDAWAGLAVGAYIGWSGIELIRDTVNPLLGQAPDPELVQHIRSKIMSYPGVLGTHDLMVHDYGPAGNSPARTLRWQLRPIRSRATTHLIISSRRSRTRTAHCHPSLRPHRHE